MLRIVDDREYYEVCGRISCDDCKFYDADHWHCRLKEWLEKQPRFDDKERLIPIAKVTFDEGKLEEICNKAISDLVVKCPNCGTEIKPKKEGDENDRSKT